MPNKKYRSGRLGRWGLGIFIVASLNLGTAGRGEENKALGSLTGTGKVWVDRQPAFPGTTIFAGDVVATDKDSTAVVNFPSGTAVTLAENSEVAFRNGKNQPQLNLHQGAVAVRSAGREKLRVNVLGTAVLVQGGKFPALSRIASVGGRAAVIADRGRVEVHGAGPPVILPPGGQVTWEEGQPQAGGQKAGTVSNEIPNEVVQHQGQAAEIPLRFNDSVNWEDLVRTLRTGRVRIALLDGSFLNIGARSNMRITKHDPKARQTQIELTLGRLRAEVVKLTQAGASFEVRTQTAVIGVVGTIFVIHALPNLTRLFCIEGVVSVRNINPAVVGTATSHAGEAATVPSGLPPTGAVRVATARVQSEMNQTQVGGPTAAPGAPPAAATSTARVANAASTATGTTSSALAGASISTLGRTQSTLNQAATELQSAQTSGNAALAAANAAANTASNAAVVTQAVVQSVSAAFPSACGCAP